MTQNRLTQKFLEEFQNYDFSIIQEEKLFLVGSITKAKNYFPKIESILQIKYKKLVSICSIDGLLNKEQFSSDEWASLQDIALRKLENQEAILVLDIKEYIGKQTKEEISFFRDVLQKPIYFLSDLNNMKQKKENE
ncbi:MAG: hypothetical protein P8Y70_12915 [Candidatus Lokiarchaeota archaeon]